MATATSTGSWLDPPELHGKRNSDGTFTLEELELKRLNDYNRKVAKMIQGGLNLANLNAAANQVFTDIQGNVTEVTATAQGLESRVSSAEGNIVTAQQTASSASVTASNALGEVQQVKLTVDGFSIADETGSYTIIDGDKLVSKDYTTSEIVEIKDGSIFIKNGTTLLGKILPSPTLGIFIEAGAGKYVYLSGKVQVGMYDEVGINGSLINLASGGNMSIDSSGIMKLSAGGNMSIESDGTIYIGGSGTDVRITGNVYINGVQIGGIG